MTKKKTTKQLVGKALRDVKDKTVLVEVSRLKIHPLYKRRYTSSKKILCHSDLAVKKGQQVSIQLTRPISKKKSWKVVEVK